MLNTSNEVLPKRFLVAPDKFKGSATAHYVAQCIAETIIRVIPDASVVQAPIADGGDGSLEILMGFDFRPVQAQSYNALMEPVNVVYGKKDLPNGSLAFLEMASICGITSLIGRELQPHFASSYGLGEVAYQALDAGVDEIIVSVGGSASTDGGIGFLVGLGAIVRNSSGSRVAPNLDGLIDAYSIDLSLLHPRTKRVKWTFLVDVLNPLVGKSGAAYTFGPQKGLRDDELEAADSALRHWAKLLQKVTGVDVSDIPGTGAAGGIGSLARSIFDAEFRSGAEWFASHLEIEDKVLAADIVITGEGSFDAQSLTGKGPGYLLSLAQKAGKDVVVVAGQIQPELKQLEGVIKKSLLDVSGDLQKALSEPLRWLTAATEEALKELTQESEKT